MKFTHWDYSGEVVDKDISYAIQYEVSTPHATGTIEQIMESIEKLTLLVGILADAAPDETQNKLAAPLFYWRRVDTEACDEDTDDWEKI